MPAKSSVADAVRRLFTRKPNIGTDEVVQKLQDQFDPGEVRRTCHRIRYRLKHETNEQKPLRVPSVEAGVVAETVNDLVGGTVPEAAEPAGQPEPEDGFTIPYKIRTEHFDQIMTLTGRSIGVIEQCGGADNVRAVLDLVRSTGKEETGFALFMVDKAVRMVEVLTR